MMMNPLRQPSVARDSVVIAHWRILGHAACTRSAPPCNNLIMSKKESFILWLVIVAAFIPMTMLRDLTPDNEMRYVSIADAALRSGHFFAFTLNGAPYADKPPFYLWLVMLCKVLAGKHVPWLLSMLSLVPAVAIAAIMERLSAIGLSGRQRALARLMLMTSAYYAASAIVVRMDMLMSLFIVLALHTFWQLYCGTARPAHRWLLPVWLFLAVFTKGPLGLLLPVATVLGFLAARGKARRFFAYLDWRTWTVLAVACTAWFAAGYHEGGSAYVYNLLVHQTLGRAFNAFHHRQPIYFYLVSMWQVLAPWSLLAVGAIVCGMRQRARLTSLQQFMLSAVLLPFVLLSCISSKLPVYLLPTLPFAIFFTVSMLPHIASTRWARWCIAVPAALLCLALPALVVASGMHGLSFLASGLLVAAAGCLTLSGAVALGLMLRRPAATSLPLRVVAAGMLLALFLAGLDMPHLNPFFS